MDISVINWLGVPAGTALVSSLVTWVLSARKFSQLLNKVNAEVKHLKNKLAELEAEMQEMKESLKQAISQAGGFAKDIDLSEFMESWNEKWLQLQRNIGQIEGELKMLTGLK